MKKRRFSLKNPVLNLRRNDGMKTNDMYLENWRVLLEQ